MSVAAAKFSCPNWAQSAMAEKIGLNPKGISVRFEDDSKICYLDHKSRKEYLVDKTNGQVIVS